MHHYKVEICHMDYMVVDVMLLIMVFGYSHGLYVGLQISRW